VLPDVVLRVRLAVIRTATMLLGVVVSCTEPSPPGPDPGAGGVADAGSSGEVESGSGDTGASSGQPEASAECPLPGSYGSAGCNACVRRTCCELVSACDAEPACRELQRCLLACLDRPNAGACYDECVARNEGGLPTWMPVESCWFEDLPNCGLECS
jgi:hypothetical protein